MHDAHLFLANFGHCGPVLTAACCLLNALAPFGPLFTTFGHFGHFWPPLVPFATFIPLLVIIWPYFFPHSHLACSGCFWPLLSFLTIIWPLLTAHTLLISATFAFFLDICGDFWMLLDW